MARLEQARATAAIQVATLFPTVSTSPGVTRQRLSGNRPTNGGAHHAKAHYTKRFFPCRSRSVMKSICLAAEGAVLRRRKPPIKPTPRTLRMCGYWLLRSSPATFHLRELDSECADFIRTGALQKGLDLVNSRQAAK